MQCRIVCHYSAGLCVNPALQPALLCVLIVANDYNHGVIIHIFMGGAGLTHTKSACSAGLTHIKTAHSAGLTHTLDVRNA